MIIRGNTYIYILKKDVICMCDGEKNPRQKKGDEEMTMMKEKMSGKQEETISRQALREKLIQETMKENRPALKRLSRT